MIFWNSRAEGTGKAARSSSPVDPTPQQSQYYPHQKKSSPLQKSPTSSFSPPTPSPPYKYVSLCFHTKVYYNKIIFFFF